jgi:CCR4-NOT transcription complex subunit 2
LLSSGAVASGVSRMSGLYGLGNELDVGLSTHLDGESGIANGLLGGSNLSSLGGLRSLQSQSTGPSTALPSNLSVRPQTTTSSTTSALGAINNNINSSPGTFSSPSGSTPVGGTALSGDYGLLGLLSVIRMTDADRNALALGSDLTLLGLNLGTTEQIYSTFVSPWSDSTSKVTKEPHYQVRGSGSIMS